MFKLAVKSKQEFQQEMAKEMQIFFSELLASIGTTKKGERDNAGARIVEGLEQLVKATACLLYTSPSPRDGLLSRMPSSA